MDAEDKTHIKKAIEQLQIFLLSGLIAQSSSSSLSSVFLDTTVRLLSNAMMELSQISQEFKEKLPDIDWNYMDMLKKPENVRRECLMHSTKTFQIIRESIPQLLEKLKNALKSEN